MGIWEEITAWIQDCPEADRLQILAPFGWWYGSGCLDPSWADEQLLHLLQIGVHVDPDFRVGKRLTTRATEDLPAALRDRPRLSQRADNWLGALFGARFVPTHSALRSRAPTPRLWKRPK